MNSSADTSPWSSTADSLLRELSVAADRGLTQAEVLQRRKTFGRNQLAAIPRRRALSILLSQFRSVVVLLLLAAGTLALLFSDFAEGVAIFAVIVINGAIGFLTELRAVRSMEALREFARVECVVLRDGKAEKISAADVVPGDIVVFEAGDLVPADIRLVEAAKLTANESTLTGESLPVHKDTQVLGPETAVLERSNLLFKGTSIARGSGRGVVFATGGNTEFGRIFEQVAAAKPQQTPLEIRLNRLGARLVWFIGLIAVLIAAAGIIGGRDIFLAIEVAIALSVAAIPEGLAIVATIALARGMWKMAERNALITRLSAVETLGATSVILTDKTGTLTENRMAVSTVLLAVADVELTAGSEPDACRYRVEGHDVTGTTGSALDELLRVAALCSNASFEQDAQGRNSGTGDPTELALLVAAAGRGIWRSEVTEQAPEISEDPFDPDSKRMATLHRLPDGVLVAVKGAPEAIIPDCVSEFVAEGAQPMNDERRTAWLDRAEKLGHGGLRTLAVAQKQTTSAPTSVYDELVLIGVVGLEDPARAGVAPAIARCRKAGIRVVMVTGDHAATAGKIAVATGIIQTSADAGEFCNGADVDTLFDDERHAELLGAHVFSRVTPEQKLRLIDLYQQNGHVVAMTGDGVNDAPALRKADIGIAMGLRGTAVAKEAAEMILQDDEFDTIVAAVAHGRAIFENIRKFVVYLLSCNSSEVLVISLATLAGGPLPLLPLQILFLNFVTDVFPALALGVGAGSSAVMNDRPRRPDERLVTNRHWRRIGLHGVVIALCVLLSMALALYGLGFDYRHGVSVAFCTLALAQMWHVFNMRDRRSGGFSNEITGNPWIWIALVICLVFVLAAIYLPWLSEVLSLADPGIRGWALIVPMSVVPVLVGPIVTAFTKGEADGIAVE